MSKTGPDPFKMTLPEWTARLPDDACLQSTELALLVPMEPLTPAISILAIVAVFLISSSWHPPMG